MKFRRILTQNSLSKQLLLGLMISGLTTVGNIAAPVTSSPVPGPESAATWEYAIPPALPDMGTPSQGMLSVQAEDGKWGFIKLPERTQSFAANQALPYVIPPRFQPTEWYGKPTFLPGKRAVVSENGEDYILVDSSGNRHEVPFDLEETNIGFSHGLAIVQKTVKGERRYGAIDQDWNLVVPIRFSLLDDFTEDGMAWVTYPAGNGQWFWGVINRKGTLVQDLSPLGFGNVGFVGPTSLKNSFWVELKEGMAILDCGMNSATSHPIYFRIPPIYRGITNWVDGRALARTKTGTTVLINSSGEVLREVAVTPAIIGIGPNAFEGSLDFWGTFVIAETRRTADYWHIGRVFDLDGNDLLGTEVNLWTQNEYWTEELYAVQDVATKKWGFLDRAGKLRIPQNDEQENPPRFSEGVAAMEVNGKFGYIDHDGKEFIPFIFDGASDFSEGYAVVLVGDKYGLIRKKD